MGVDGVSGVSSPVGEFPACAPVAARVKTNCCVDWRVVAPLLADGVLIRWWSRAVGFG